MVSLSTDPHHNPRRETGQIANEEGAVSTKDCMKNLRSYVRLKQKSDPEHPQLLAQGLLLQQCCAFTQNRVGATQGTQQLSLWTLLNLSSAHHYHLSSLSLSITQLPQTMKLSHWQELHKTSESQAMSRSLYTLQPNQMAAPIVNQKSILRTPRTVLGFPRMVTWLFFPTLQCAQEDSGVLPLLRRYS